MGRNLLDRVSRVATVVVEAPAVVIMVVMMLHVVGNALSRRLLGNSWFGTLEITEFWYVPVMAMLGFIAALIRGQHVAADLIFDKLPDVTKKWVIGFTEMSAALVCAGLAYFSFPEALKALDRGFKAGNTDVSTWPVYFLSTAVMAVLAVMYAVAAIRVVVKGYESPDLTDDVDALVVKESV